MELRYSIIGPSGTGKSTFLRCLNRLETPDGGSILVNGVDVTDPKADLAAVRRKMGMVFQNFNLFGNLTVLGNIMAAQSDLPGVSKDAAKKKALELLGRVGLANRADALPDELSGGQKQRVAIVRDVSTRVLYMDEGVIYEEGTPNEIFHHPQKPKTVEFVGQVCLKHARDMVRLLRESILEDGKIDEVEAQMLMRLAEPFERFGDGKVSRFAEALRKMLSDGVITDEESKRIALILKRF